MHIIGKRDSSELHRGPCWKLHRLQRAKQNNLQHHVPWMRTGHCSTVHSPRGPWTETRTWWRNVPTRPQQTDQSNNRVLRMLSFVHWKYAILYLLVCGSHSKQISISRILSINVPTSLLTMDKRNSYRFRAFSIPKCGLPSLTQTAWGLLV